MRFTRKTSRPELQTHLIEMSSIEPTNQAEQLTPIEEQLRKLSHGPYYIAPDSADPLPDTIWTRADLEDLNAEFELLNEMAVDGLTADDQEAPDVMTRSFFYLMPAQRAYLLRVGGPAVKGLLETFQQLDEVSES